MIIINKILKISGILLETKWSLKCWMLFSAISVSYAKMGKWNQAGQLFKKIVRLRGSEGIYTTFSSAIVNATKFMPSVTETNIQSSLIFIYSNI